MPSRHSSAMHVTNPHMIQEKGMAQRTAENPATEKQNAGSQNSEYFKVSLESPGQLRALADLGAEEEDEVDEAAETEGYEADGRHGPGGAHVLEH